MFLPSEHTSDKTADVVIYGHIHHSYMDKIYNKTLINVGSVGNSYATIRNNERDSDVRETTRINYLIIEGDYGKKEYTSDFSFEFIQIPYNVEEELKNEKLNIEKDDYRYELINGKYRNMTKVIDNFKRLGIDVSNMN